MTGTGSPGEPELWTADVEECADWAEAAAEGVLDEEEQRRAAAFVRGEDRRCYRVAHLALRLLLGARTGTEPGALRLVREPCPRCAGPHGRPALEGGGVHFSLAHTRGLVLLGLAAVPLGVDVEAVPTPAQAENTAAVLHPDEREELALLPAADRPAAFVRAWVRKEAYLKGIGAGLSRSPALDYVGTGTVPPPHGPPGWSLSDVAVPAGYAAAVAVVRGAAPQRSGTS